MLLDFHGHIDELIEYNYCMYQNNNYSNKWYYAYITGMRYDNDGLTLIDIVTDVFQTWQFDIIYKMSTIEREMIDVANDIPGANLIPEGLELGELKVGGIADFDELTPIAVIAYSRNPHDDGLTENPIVVKGVNANGIPGGVYYCVCSFKYVTNVLDSINEIGHGDAVLTVFSIPAFAIVGYNGWTLEQILSEQGVLWWITTNVMATPQFKTLISTPTHLDNYVPRNQKLRTYPYMYLGFNPIQGSSKIYRYEDFENGSPQFKMISEINQNPTICYIPQNYRGKNGDSLQDVATMNGFPTLGFLSDHFNSWLLQNANIMQIEAEKENYSYLIDVSQKGIDLTAGTLSSVFKLDMFGAIGGSSKNALDMVQLDKDHANYYKKQMAQVEQQQMLPNNATLGGSNATLLGYGLVQKNIFTRYTIKSQFAKRIDDYWDMYGYETNEIKLPNINNRPNWNYVKTIGANLLGNIPQADLQTLKNMFDSGLTLWHNPDTFLDYSQNNR